jgi:hypothetical protein
LLYIDFRGKRDGGEREMGRWGDGEMGRWGDGEMGRWGDGEKLETKLGKDLVKDI